MPRQCAKSTGTMSSMRLFERGLVKQHLFALVIFVVLEGLYEGLEVKGDTY